MGRGAGAAAGAHHRQPAAKVAEEEDDKETDQWVQCSKCQTWRQVPDEFWPDIANADEDEDWTCKVGAGRQGARAVCQRGKTPERPSSKLRTVSLRRARWAKGGGGRYARGEAFGALMLSRRC